MQRIQHRRFTDGAAGWPVAAIMAGEIVVNPLKRAMAVGDVDGTVREFIGIRVFDARSQYVVGDLVTNNSKVYRCKTSIGVPHAFDQTEWEDIARSSEELYNLLDLRYALIDHDHDGVYSPINHTHVEYALVNHTHSQYALVSHTHTGTYARLSGDTFTGAVNFNNIVKMKGTYANAVMLGVGGDFVPAATIHARVAGMPVIRAETTTDGQQARFMLKNPDREFIIYEDAAGGAVRIYDLTGNREIAAFPWSAAEPVEVNQSFLAANHISAVSNVHAAGDLSDCLFGPLGTSRVFQFKTNYRLELNASNRFGMYLNSNTVPAWSSVSGEMRINNVHDAINDAGHIQMRYYPDAISLPPANESPNALVVYNDLDVGRSIAWSKETGSGIYTWIRIIPPVV